MLYPVGVHIRFTPAPLFQRACRQCVHESAQFFRAICSHAWYSKNCGERQNRRLSRCLFAACTCHAWLARPTRARGKSSQREGNALFDDFWYFSSQKSTIKEKLHYDSSLSEFFSLVRKERKGQKEECFPLLNTFCRLAATGANKVPRPSRYSIPRLQVRNAQAPTRIYCCAMSGYGEPRGSSFGESIGANIAR